MNDLKVGLEEWVSSQMIPRPLPEVFSFFSRAENLEILTPPWLNFKILEVKHPAGSLDTGSLIDYSLKIHGLPVRWRTLIQEWVPNEKFVDTQVRGPYRYWHHTHEFQAVGNETLMKDKVRYQLPFGRVGRWAAGGLVKSEVRKIFEFRNQKIVEIFSG